MAGRSSALRGHWVQIAVTIAFAGSLTGLLMIGLRHAEELQSASSAMQLVSELSSRPQILRSEMTLIQRGLETTTYVGESLQSITAIRDSSNRVFSAIQQDLRGAGLANKDELAAPLAEALKRWQNLDRELEVVGSKRAGEMYSDTASGSELTTSGRQLKAAVDEVLATQSRNLQVMGEKLRELGASLHDEVTESGRSLRILLMIGSTVAAGLLMLVLYFAYRERESAAAAATAQRQVANILGTVREGLFLVGRDLCLGETCSESLTELLRLTTPAGRAFEDVLRPLVDEKTLVAALKFLGLLWKDKVNEELIESVNPLSQIEVSFTNSHGGSEVRYLAFSFRRVRGAEASGDYILGMVADVTDRVLLARELEHAKVDGDSQAAFLLELLRVDPAQLQAFLGSADIAFRKSNAVLTAPGIEQQDLQTKLNGVFRELHAVKGEAAALTLTSFVQRIHIIEDTLSTLRAKSTLSGSDFLPVVVKLDEVMSHVATMHSMQERVASFRATSLAPSRPQQPQLASLHETTIITAPVVLAAPPPGAPRPSALTDMLRGLAQEIARAQSCAVQVRTRGLEDVPARYSGVVKDICIQMVRNSIVHGIEPPQLRSRRGKLDEGTVQISWADDSPDDYMLTIEDDGRGLSYELILDKALRQGLLRPQQAASLDRTAAYRFIFQPGFSTAEEISEHAGRGVGLDAVGTLVREHGGKIGVSTAAGQYTRFKVLLPKALPSASSASSAA